MAAECLPGETLNPALTQGMGQKPSNTGLIVRLLLNCHPDVLHAVVVVLDGGGVPPDPLHAPLEHEPLLGHVSRHGAVSAAGKLVEGRVEPATLQGLVQCDPLV